MCLRGERRVAAGAGARAGFLALMQPHSSWEGFAPSHDTRGLLRNRKAFVSCRISANPHPQVAKIKEQKTQHHQ